MTQTRKELVEQVGALIERGLGTGLHVPQDTGLLHIAQEELDEVTRLLADTADFLAAVSSACERLSDAEHEAEYEDATIQPGDLADLAYVGRAELLELAESLDQSIEANSKWQIAAKADRASGRSVRALLPVESALREYLGLAPAERRWFDLDDTLTIRRRFCGFWLEAKRAGDPSGADLRKSLERIAMMVDELRQAPIYPFLRLDDRLDLRALQKRIMAWLEGDGTSGKERDEAGRRLWQDATGFFDLLMQINRREELREHDLRTVGKLIREVGNERVASDPVSDEIFAELRDLCAQHQPLDALILAGEAGKRPRTSDFEAPLRSLHKSLLRR